MSAATPASPTDAEIVVRKVETRRERDAFIKFPWQIYPNDPAWVPPLIIERREFLDRKHHPFYQHGDAALFLASRNGTLVGRIMASDDPNYNALHGSSAGCFGLFESINDQQVAAALFDAASAWLRAKGRTELLGPIDYSTNYVCGLLIEGFQYPPTLLTAHNPAYYERLLEGCGFTKAKDFYAWWYENAAEASPRLRRIGDALMKRHHVTIRRGNMRDLAGESRRLRQIYNQAWEKNWGFVPFTEAEFDYMTKELRPIVMPEITALAEIDGEPVGFALAAPDINVVLQKINGRLTRFGLPIGLAKLLYYRRRLKRARLIALGVVEKHRRHGIAEALVSRVVEAGMIGLGMQGELSLTLEDNHMINRFVEAIGARRYKTYRIYRQAIPA